MWEESRSPVYDELMPGEQVLWEGQPVPRVVFSAVDIFLIPFGIAWLGASIFMTVIAFRDSLFLALYGLVFVAAGMYLLFGRYYFMIRRNKNTWYAVTNKRVLSVARKPKNKRREVLSTDIACVPKESVKYYRNGIGSVVFGNAPAGYSLYNDTPIDKKEYPGPDIVRFRHIADPDSALAAYRSAKKRF